MSPYNIVFTVESVNLGHSEVLLCEKTPYWEFDKKTKARTTEAPAGVRYTVSLLYNGLQQFSVKVPGIDTTPEIDSDTVAARAANLEFIKAVFRESRVQFYKIGDQDITT